MPTTAILPVKRFGNAKQRLSPALGAGARNALTAAMFADVLSALNRSQALETVVIVSGEPEMREVEGERHILLIQDITEKGQAPAALSGIARAAALGYSSALLVPGDCPLLDPRELDALVDGPLAERDVVIVPDRHRTGTNALLLDPSGPFQPQFGPDSLRLHVEQAKRRGLTHAVEELPSLSLDVDTDDDLAELIRELDRRHGHAPRTRGVLRQIERSAGRPPIPV